MKDAEKINTLTGPQKKQLIIDTLDKLIISVFDTLNQSPPFSNSHIDEIVKDLLLILLPKAIDTIIYIDHGNLKIKSRSWC